MFTWCTMPVPGGTTLNWLNASWPQRRNWNRSWLRSNSISTFRLNASGLPNTSATTEWSMTSSAGHERVDLGRVAAEGLHGLAHRGQVDHGGHAGQVLQDDPGRGELDLGVRLVQPGPTGPAR